MSFKTTHIPIAANASSYHIPLDKITYNQDGLISMHNVQSLESGRFADAYALAQSIGGWTYKSVQVNIHWRAHIIYWAALQAAHLQGDFVECGVNKGGTAVMAIESLDRKVFEKRRFFLYDTFYGLDETISSCDELLNTQDIYSECYEEVKKKFEIYPFVEIVRGSVPQSLHLYAPNKVAYLHIDLNAAKPEIAALEFFWNRLVPGALVIFDDYAWMACAAQKSAIDSFLNPLGAEVLTIPTGQGLVIKH
jgi:O-methyltransferase